jgi:exodeoxyribonuclease-3
MTRLISWNVNGVRSAASKGLLAWLDAERPDILCLQETKADPDQLQQELLEPVDSEGRPYRAYWASAKKRGYSGVAIWSREEPRSVSFMGISEFDDEGRTLVADYGAFVLVSAYFPNSQDAGARLPFKLGYCAAMKDLLDGLVAKGRRVLVCGDFNIAHKPIDLARPKENEGNPGYLPEERAWMDSFLGSGYVDTFRMFDPSPGKYSWWSYRMKAREKNVGWRIDYHCVDSGLAPAVKGAAILDQVQGSDHCPVVVELDA